MQSVPTIILLIKMPFVITEENFDADKFISLVKENESIWNYKSPIYTNKIKRREDWMSICEAMVDDFGTKTSEEKSIIALEFQNKWKVLRDGFTRSIKNYKKKCDTGGHKGKLYTYYTQLKFLNNLYGSDAMVIVDEKSGEASTQIEEKKRKKTRRKSSETSLEDNDSVQPIITRSDKPSNNETNKESRYTNDVEFDEDKHFLLSLLSDFKKIPSEHKLDAKGDIINVIRHYRKTSGTLPPTNRSFYTNGIAALSTEANERLNSFDASYDEATENVDDNSPIEMKFIIDS